MQKLKIAFLLNPLREMLHQEDTSFALMRECQERGHHVFCFESRDLRLHHSTLSARLSKCQMDWREGVLPDPPKWVKLTLMDAVIIRKEPPFDLDYLSATYLLDFIRGKIFLMNDPSGVRTVNEKLSAMHFPAWTPLTSVGYQLEAFSNALQRSNIRQWVIKPLFNKGGVGIERISRNDRRLKQKLARATSNGRIPVMLQQYVKHARQGDKRILILNGRPIGAFRRVPGKKDFRANMALGGKARSAAITARERRLVRSLKPYLSHYGLHFAGIDVLNGRLTEINVTSPAGIPEINRFTGGRLEHAVVNYIEKQARS